MHITFTTDEKKYLKGVKLPNDTTLLQCRKDENETPMYRFVTNDDEWVLETDFIENSRPWKKGEKEAFLNNLSREQVIDYFISHKNKGPQREYSAMSNAEYKFFKFVKHSGTYAFDEKTKEHRNVFNIRINQDSDLSAAEEEITWAFNRMAKAFPKWNPIYINILEHTCSEYATYYAYWDRDNQFRLMKSTYGYEEQINEFKSWTDFIKYISKNHYYE